MTLLLSNKALRFGNPDPLTAQEVVGQRAWGGLCGWGTVTGVRDDEDNEIAVIELDDGLTVLPPLYALVEAGGI